MGRKKTTQDRFNDPFPTRFRELSEKAALNQTQIGEAVGKTRQTISDYQSGISMPDVETVVLLANLFGVSTDYLLGIPGSVPTLDPDLQAMCRYLRLSEETVRAIARAGALEFNEMPDRFLNTRLYQEFITCLYHLESLSGQVSEAITKAGDPEETPGNEWDDRMYLRFSDRNKELEELQQKIKAERYALWEKAEDIAAELTECREAEDKARKWCWRYEEQHEKWMKKEV